MAVEFSPKGLASNRFSGERFNAAPTGIFPETNESLENRWKQAKFLVEHLHNIRKDELKNKVQACKRAIRRTV